MTQSILSRARRLRRMMMWLILFPTVILAQKEQPPEPLAEMPAKVYEKVMPSVAMIRCEGGTKVGSGIVIATAERNHAIILTACHVVASNYDKVAADPMLALRFHGDLEAKIGADSLFLPALAIPERYELSNDLALIVTRKPVAHSTLIKFNHSSDIKPGQKVATFGFPDAVQVSQTVGLIKRLEDKFIVSDAHIAPGSSGGPLVDKHGRMIGMSLITIDDEGYALPLDILRPVVSVWLENMRLIATWQRQKYRSVWDKMYRNPVFLVTEAAVIGGAAYLLSSGTAPDATFGEPPKPTEIK